MSQGSLSIPNESGAAFRADVNTNLQALGTLQSGATAPTTTYAYMLWADTTNNQLKQRDGSNASWIVLGTLGTANLGLATLASPTFTGNVVFPAGTVTANGIQVGTGTTYKPGIYSPGTDQLAISTGGTGRLFVDSSGRLGLGTSSPSTTLHVVGDTTIKASTGGVASVSLYSDRATSTLNNQGAISWFDNSSNILASLSCATVSGNTQGNLHIYTANTSNTGLPSQSSFTLSKEGRLGIGTTSPSQALEVAGTIQSTSSSQPILLLNSTASGSWKSNIRFQNSGTAKYEIGADTSATGANNFYFYDAVAGVNRAIIDASGNFQFNSGYGSAATAYGCRAWVNFNGTTASPSTIRGSGNVSSVTKNGTGDYTVNFTTALVDANYAVSAVNDFGNGVTTSPLSFATSSVRIQNYRSSTTYDANMYVAIFR